MANTQNILVDLGVTNNNVIKTVTKVRQEIQMTQTVVNVFNQNINKTFNNLEKAKPDSFIETLGRVAKGFSDFTVPGAAFEQTLADLSAKTGITGEELDLLGQNARKIGQSSGMGATQALKAYQALANQVNVSKIGITGLNALQTQTMTLAKASGMEVGKAASALTDTIVQFGLEATEAGRVMNVLAAGAKYGAMGIPDLSNALAVVSASAKSAGVSVETATGALGVLSQNNLKGADAGEALNDILLNMQHTLGIDFSKTSLSTVLDDLKPKLNDTAYLTQVFGDKNMAAVQYLIGNASAVGEMTEKVTDSNVAQEQAAIRSQTTADRMARIRQTVEDLKISLFNLTGGAGGYIAVMNDMTGDLSKLTPLLQLMGTGLNYVTNSEKLHVLWAGITKTALAVWTGVQWVLNASLWACPLTWIVAGIIAFIGAVVLICTKITGWGSLWKGIVDYMKYNFMGFVEGVKLYWDTWVNGFMIGINGMLRMWYMFKNAVGLGDEGENNAAIAKIDADSAARIKATVDGAKKVMEYGKKAQDSLNGIKMGWKGGEEEEKGNAVTGEAASMAGAGISSVSLPGTDNASLVPTYQTASPAAVQDSSQSAVSGGTRSQHVTVNLGKLMDNVNIYAQEFRDGLNDLDNKVLESLTRVLNVAQSNAI